MGDRMTIALQTIKDIANQVESACEMDVRCEAKLKTDGLHIRMVTHRPGDYARDFNRLIRYEELEGESTAGYLVEEAIARMRRELGLT